MAEIRVLSIDGGGIRGIIPATVLRHIEEQTGKPICDHFHLVAGTSTGGILASGLSQVKGKPIASAEDLLNLYVTRGGQIFSRSLWKKVESAGGFSDEKYSARALERALSDVVGRTRLGQVENDLLVTAYDIENRSPYFFKSWRARGETWDAGDPDEDRRGRDFPLVQVARATSAAPTYFEPALVENGLGDSHALIDGGVYVNNPSMCAFASARRIYGREHSVYLVSLGTGLTQRPIHYDEAKDWGLLSWARRVIDIVFDGVSDAADYQLREILGPDTVRLDIDLQRWPDDPDAPNDEFDDASADNIRRLQLRAKRLMQAEADRIAGIVDRLNASAKAPPDDVRPPG